MSNDSNDTPASQISPEAADLLLQISSLAMQQIAHSRFFAEMLPRAIAAVGGEAGAVWIIDPQRRLVLEREQGLMVTGFLEDPMMKAAFEQPFKSAIERCAVIGHADRQEKLDGPGREFSLILGGLWSGRQPAGLIQIVEPQGQPRETQAVRIAIIEQVCQSAMTFLNRSAAFPAPNVSSTQSRPAPPTIPSAGPTLTPVPQIPTIPPAPGVAPVVPSQSTPRMPPLAPQGMEANPFANQGLPVPLGTPRTGSGGGQVVVPQVIPAPVGNAAPVKGEVIPLDGVLSLYDHLRVRDAALVAANEGRRWLAVDRVSVAERVGTKLIVMAISGSQSVNPRSNVVQLLSQLADKVVQSGDRLIFDGESHTLPPLLEAPLANYLHESRSRAVVISPLFDPIAMKKFQEAGLKAGKDPVQRPKPIGAVVVEQISDSPMPMDLENRLDVFSAHAALAMRNAQEHERIFLLPVWRFLGGYSSWFRGRRLAQWLGGLVAAAAIVAALIYVPWEYRVEGKGRMMPTLRQEVFAPWDGVVEQVGATDNANDLVTTSDVILRLKNEELDSKLHAQESLLAEKLSQIEGIIARLNENSVGLTRAQVEELGFDKQKLETEVTGIKGQIDSLTNQIAGLTVKARLDGRIATFRARELLLHRPVRRGELLLQIMNPESSWQLEIDVPENRLGHILNAQAVQVDPSKPLTMTYILATETEKTWTGTLDKMGNRAVVSEKEGAVVPMIANLDAIAPRDKRIGAEVVVKINCGKKPLGYVLFGDVIEFLRKKLWF